MRLSRKALPTTLALLLCGIMFAIPALAYHNTEGWISDVKIKANSADQAIMIRLKDANGNLIYPCGSSYPSHTWAYRGTTDYLGEGAVDRVTKLVIAAKLANAKIGLSTNLTGGRCLLEQISLVD